MKSWLQKLKAWEIHFNVSSSLLASGIAWLLSLYIGLASAPIIPKIISFALLIFWLFKLFKEPKTWKLSITYFEIALALLFILIISPFLNRSILFKGDEGFHIQIAIGVLSIFKKYSSIAILSIIYLFLFNFLYKKNKNYVVFFLTFIFVCITHFTYSLTDYESRIFFRWPLAQYFFTYPFIAINSFFKFSFNPYQEWIYRIIPFMSFTMIAYQLSKRLSLTIGSFVSFIFVITIPVFQYYSFVFYQEPLSLCLFFVALLKYRDNNNLITPSIAWLFMLSIIFKDSFLLYVLIFLICDFIFSIKKDLSLKNIFYQGVNYLFIITPGVIFKIAQTTPYDSSGTSLVIPTLTDVFVLFHSIQDQYVALFLISLLVILYKGKYIFELLFVLIILIFYIFNPVTNTYLGYSRYSLIIVCALLAIISSNSILFFRHKLISILAVVGIFINIYSSPFNYDRGTFALSPKWGDYKKLTSEFWYDYDNLYRDMKNKNNLNIAVIGRSYYYYDSFYHFKYGLSITTFNDFRTAQTNRQLADSLTQYNPNYLIRQFDPLLPFEVSPAILQGFDLQKRYQRGQMVLELYRAKSELQSYEKP